MRRKSNHRFDKIIKENLTNTFLPIAEKYLNISIQSSEPLPEKLQTTLEREPDFIRKIVSEEGEEFILQIEFQTRDDAEMVFRMAEYRAIIQRKYKLSVRQFVLYLGEKPSKMESQLPESMQISGFTLASFNDLPYQELTSSDIPEEIILAILADFQNAPPLMVIRLIIRRLKQVCENKGELEKYILQLNILSKLRKLDSEIIKEVEAMPIVYDIKKDAFYKKGVKEGLEEGLEKGLERGLEKGLEKGKVIAQKEAILSLYKEGTLSLPKIASILDVSESFILEVVAEAENI